jgi:Peptidase family M48
MNLRGRSYPGLAVEPGPGSGEISPQLRVRLRSARAGAERVLAGIPQARGRLVLGRIPAVADPRMTLYHRGRPGQGEAAVLEPSLALLENLSAAELDAIARHELVHIDQRANPDPQRAAAIAWADAHGLEPKARATLVAHYARRREFDADREAVMRYGADPGALITALTQLVALRRELGLQMDYEAPDAVQTSPHPRLEERVERLQALVGASPGIG